MKVLELFGGIGAIRCALIENNVAHTIVDYVEIDKFAVKSYNQMYKTEYKPQDIRKWDKNITADLIFHGSPCQDFSTAGLNKGGEHGSGTRSSLLWETIRIVKNIMPKYIIWENVPGVLNQRHKNVFYKYIKTLQSLGYNTEYKILNSADFGIPQGRKRVFCISILNFQGEINFPEPISLKNGIFNILEDKVDNKYYLSDKAIAKMIRFKSNTEVSLCPTITTELAHHSGKNFMPKWVKLIGEYRRPTPRECFRLQGFSDLYYNRINGVSDTQLYKQAANSITVNVLQHILKTLEVTYNG